MVLGKDGKLKDVEIYRMVLEDHVCPYGEKAVALLNDKGVDFIDHHLTTRDDVERFKEEHGVKTTPQIFSQNDRIGGYSELAEFFQVDTSSSDRTYAPVFTVFAVALLMAITLSFSMTRFMGFSLCLLALLKLMNLSSFARGFKQYDILSMIIPKYAFAFPFLELAIGLGFLSNSFQDLVGLGAFLLGVLGTCSIYKAVYVEGKDLNCACVGGGADVPLAAVSISENIIMSLMGLWILL